MLKSFFRYVLPAMLAFAFSGLYTIVDGFFIGRNIGDAGLAAVSIAYPLAALLQAIGTGIGMGGAIKSSVCRGKGDLQEENAYFANTITLLVITGIAATAALLFFRHPVLALLGAKGIVLDYGAAYLGVIAAGALFQLCATGFTPLLRNRGGSLAAMSTMIAGFLTNIVLDALFVAVLHMGMAGAALATVIGQFATMLPCALLLAKRSKGLGRAVFHLRKPLCRAILTVGASPFGLALSPSILLMLMNKSAMRHGGETAVAAYAVVTYVAAIVLLLFQGIGDGSQPLMSLSIGIGREEDARKIRNLSLVFSCAVAAASMAAVLFLRHTLPGFFGAGEAAAALAARSFAYSVVGFLFVAFCRTATSYFYATGKNALSYGLVYSEPILLGSFLLLLPRIWGLEGVWLSVPAAQALLALMGLILIRWDGMSIRRRESPVPCLSEK